MKKILILLFAALAFYIGYINLSPGHYRSHPCVCSVIYMSDEDYQKLIEKFKEEQHQIYSGNGLISINQTCTMCRPNRANDFMRFMNNFIINKN